MNKCKLLLLWQRQSARFFHLLHGRNYSMLMNNNNGSCLDHGWHCSTAAAINSNANGGRNSGINRHHHHLLLLRPTFKANSQQQHFCTTPNLQSSDQTINSNDKLPDSIDQQCKEWAQILRAEWEIKNAKHNWHDKKLRCTNVFSNINSSKLFLSNEQLNPEQWRTLCQSHKIGDSVELKMKQHVSHHQQQQSNSPIVPADNNNTIMLLGIVRKQFPDGISIRIHRRLNIQETQCIQQCSFEIRKTENPQKLEDHLTFIARRHSDWCKWPGYTIMLQSFKCQPLPEDTGLDPTEWAGSHGKDLDPSQCIALSAALNLKRPIVAVHGPPGSGKTHLLAEYLHILSQQGKKVLVVSSTSAGLYHLMGTFCKKFPSAASSNGTFICLQRFNAQLASKVIANETIERLIKRNSIAELQKNVDEKTREFYDQTKALKSAIEETQDFSKEECSKQEAEELTEKMRDIGHQKKDETSKKLLQSTSVLFINTSLSMLNLFTRIGLTFDVVIIDDAATMSEFDSWFMALPTAPVLRLFGDYNQSDATVQSSLGRELNFNKSLIQRLDEQFGPELNFHLRRQYRSNAAIQAWPNRAFYGQRAAEPDESVRDIRLDDLLEEGKSPPPPELITDPLVLVDLGKLEGEWRDWMFKTEKGGKSCFNWGEAFLAASHLYNLFEHIPQQHLCPSKIAYLTHYDAQRIRIERIFSTLFGHHVNSLKHISMERNANIQGKQFDVVLKDSVTVPLPDALVNPYFLKFLNYEMCRARRQFIWFANSKWLEQGSEQSRQLLQTFREYGRIVGPNELLPFGPGQFSEMTKTVQENIVKMLDRRMKSSKYGKY